MTTGKLLKSSVFVLLSTVIIPCVFGVQAQAQAIFGVSAASTVLSKTGYTELVGPVTFTVASGTTTSGTLEFFLPNVAFSSSAGISLSGTGGLTGATIAGIAGDSGVVSINVPAGGGPGSTITLSGVRISGVGAKFTTLNASISATGNSIFAGENTVLVVRNVVDGLQLSTDQNSTLTVIGSVIVSGPGTFTITEPWEQGFSSAVGIYGQTNRTQIIFQVTGLPDGVSLTFPSSVASDTGTGAALVTLSGGPETLTNQSTTNRVTYEFYDTANSPLFIDSFSIKPTVGVISQVGTGSALIQVALGPIGALTPTTQYPSTAIPRYAELFIPSSTPVVPPPAIVSSLFFPVPANVDTETITVSNLDSGSASVTAVARAADGTMASGISNNVGVNLTGFQTSSLSLKDLFGSNALASGIAAVELTSGNHLAANSIGTIGNNRFGLASPPVSSAIFLPFDRRTSSDIPVLVLQNSGSSDTAAQLVLRSLTGTTVASASRTVTSHGAVRETLSSLFGSGSLPLDGYVAVSAGSPLRGVLLDNPTTRPDEVASAISVQSPSLFPFFAFGGPYNSVVSVINSSTSLSGKVTLTPYSTTGTPLVSQPAVKILAPMERQSFDFAALFGSGSGQVTVGYFTISVDSTTNTLFAVAPSVFATVRVSEGDISSVVVPVQMDAGTQFYMTPTTETANAYTGVVVVNPLSVSVNVTAGLTSSAGASVGSKTFTVSPNSAQVQLLRELIPQSLPHDNGVLSISGTTNIKVLAFRGTLNLTELIYLRGEPKP
jgi:hypothetical protein